MQTRRRKKIGEIFHNNGIAIEKQLSNGARMQRNVEQNIPDVFVWKIEKYLETPLNMPRKDHKWKNGTAYRLCVFVVMSLVSA